MYGYRTISPSVSLTVLVNLAISASTWQEEKKMTEVRIHTLRGVNKIIKGG